MEEYVKPLAQWCALIIETFGFGLITLIAILTLLHAFRMRMEKQDWNVIFRKTRQNFGQGILLGLEFLVAADIIHTVAVALSFTAVTVLALIVLIRTFLSFTLDVELTGRWPWQSKEEKKTESEIGS